MRRSPWEPTVMLYTSFFAIFCAMLADASDPQTFIPNCAVKCYEDAPAQCILVNNDCTCKASAMSAGIEGCILTLCTVKEWLVAMNATDTICDRPRRDEGRVLLVCTAVLGTLAFIAVLVRVSVAVRQKSLGYDDLFACFAACMSVPNSIGLAVSARLGLGRDIWTLTPSEITRVQKVIYICQNFYFWCSGFQKLCFLFFFLRIFPSERARQWCYVGIALSIGYAAGFGLTMTFACWPISAIWTSWTMEEKPVYCIDQNLFYYFAAAANISSDIMIALIPIPQLWRLNLTLKKKLLLSAVFGVGFVVITISCLRVQTLTKYSNTLNPTYDTLASGIWSNVELNVGVICICMPAFRRFLAHTLHKCFALRENSLSLPGEANLPNELPLNRLKRGSKRKTLPDSLFATTVVKTINSKIKAEEDELHLVEMWTGQRTEGSIASLSNAVS